MKKFDENDALKVIVTALESGSIQLIGNKNSADTETSKELAKYDATYLKTLLASLTNTDQ